MLRPYRDVPLERALEGIARAGFRYTAYLPPIYYDASATDRQLLDLRKKVESAGLRAVTAWGGGVAKWGVEGMRRKLEQAAVLGLEYLLLSSPDPIPGSEHSGKGEILEHFLRAMEALVPLADSLGIDLDVKPHHGPCGDGPGLADLVARIDHPRVKVSYDPGNIRFYEGIEPEEDLPSVARHVRSLCVKDHRGERMNREFPNPGEGDVRWERIFAVLGDAGFSGYALIEVLQGDTPEGVDAAAVRVRRRLRGWIEAEGGRVID